jgi:hypothetical protein
MERSPVIIKKLVYVDKEELIAEKKICKNLK